MCEMLANQYFMTGRFSDAEPIFQRLVSTNDRRINLVKKLIICLIQNHKYKDALSLFHSTISKNISEFKSPDNLIEACPCREIIYDLEHSLVEINPNWKNIILGILWSYCDLVISHKYFSDSIETNNNVSELKLIFTILGNEIHKLNLKEPTNGKKTD